MKGRICTTDQVRGILDGRVTMFREPLKPQPTIDLSESHQVSIPCNKAGATLIKFLTIDSYIKHKSPYHPGDIIYVREAWFYEGAWEDVTAGKPDLASGGYSDRYKYRADSPDYPVDRWYSPATMPREAARLFLRVTDVRVERVQKITGRDCQREGILLRPPFTKQELRECYRCEIWDHRYAKYPYDANPWTVAVTFEVKEGLE
jgi:hypothetical protein